MLRTPTFERHHVDALGARLREPRRFIHVLAGARQVGKTTIALQALAHYLDLLSGAGMLTGLQKYARTALRPRSAPAAAPRWAPRAARPPRP